MNCDQTFFFYDLETSGIDAKEDRIMQFAGRRTTLNLEPIGEPLNLLVKMPDDTLPKPQAIQVTGITPQATQADGLTEAELCRYLMEEVFTPGTISLGYNTIRFDDEFMRYLFWRNFYDPYEWQWKDGRGRWDMLDVVRMTRALRPEGINWPTLPDGKITNKLDMLTVANGIEHANAHDAMADVDATIAVAQLIREKQPELFNYLFEIRDKRVVQQMVNLEDKKPFVYSCGRYGTKHNFTTVAFPLTAGRNGNVLVYDLRYNLNDLMQKEQEQVSSEARRDSPSSRVSRANPRRSSGSSSETASRSFYPYVKELQYNHCPAVAPISVLGKNDGWKSIDLEQKVVEKNLKDLLAHPEFAEQMRSQREAEPDWPKAVDPESALYDGFLPDPDRIRCGAIRNADANQLADFTPDFLDERLPELLIHYKGRNFPTSLSAHEATQWEEYRFARLKRQEAGFKKAVEQLASDEAMDQGTIEDLVLWHQLCLGSD